MYIYIYIYIYPYCAYRAASGPIAPSAAGSDEGAEPARPARLRDGGGA